MDDKLIKKTLDSIIQEMIEEDIDDLLFYIKMASLEIEKRVELEDNIILLHLISTAIIKKWAKQENSDLPNDKVIKFVKKY